MAIEIISEVETLLSIIKALEALANSNIVQEDVAGLLADATQLKVVFDDVKSKMNSLISELAPELQALLHNAPVQSTDTPVIVPTVVVSQAPSSQ